MDHGRPRWRGALLLTLVVAACAGPGGSGSPAIPPTGSAASPIGPSPSGSASAEPTASVTPAPTPTSLADALASIPSREGVLNTVWIGDDRVVVGGFSGPAFQPSIRVFQGGTWTDAQVPGTLGQVAAIAESGGTLFAVGNELPDARAGFVWQSPDGLTWTAVHPVTDGALYDVAATEDTIVAVGALLTDEMAATAAAWVSTDGSTWTPADVGEANGVPMGSVAVVSGGFAATGDRPLGQDRPFWTASDPSTWTPIDNDLNDAYLPADLEAWGERIVLVGASGRSGDQHPFVAVTQDGAAWDQRLLGEEAEGYASAATVVGERLLVAGVYDDALLLFQPLEPDAPPIRVEPMGAAIGSIRWDPDWGLIGVGSKDGAHAVWLLPVE